MSKRLYGAAATAMMLLAAAQLHAVENIDFNGFMTVGATISDSSVDSENGNITDDVGFDEDTRIGLQVSADINDRMSVTAQLLGSNREEDNFDTLFDWGYINYSLFENTNLRGGKIKFPTFLISAGRDLTRPTTHSGEAGAATPSWQMTPSVQEVPTWFRHAEVQRGIRTTLSDQEAVPDAAPRTPRSPRATLRD